MRKLSSLIAIALIVTIGSVYAAWNYAQGATAEVEITREINMAQVNTNSNKGTISATPNNVAFIVDDENPGNGVYHAILTGTGSFTVNFTPATGADSTTVTTGIKMQATIEVKSKNGTKYDGKTPITHKEGENVIALNDGAATLQATLEVEDILECLELCNVNLPTKADNDAFHAVLNDYTIYITISEVA